MRKLLWIGILLLPRPAAALPDATWVVSVGNNHGYRSETGLLYAERDARAVADALRSHGGVPSRQIRVLLDEGTDTVRRTLEDINAAIRRRSDKERTALVVYYSGHADAGALHLGSDDFTLAELTDLVQGSAATLRLLVIDACRSEANTRNKGMAATESFAVDLADNGGVAGFVTIASSAAGEASQESDALRGSFFSHHLVNALRGAADNDRNGRVTLSEAYSYAYDLTVKSTGRTLALQHPTYSYDVEGQGDLILSTPGGDATRFGKLELGTAATYVIMDESRREVIAEVAPSAEKAQVAMPARSYFVQQRNRDFYREYDVRVPAGGTVRLASIASRRVEYDRLVRQRGGVNAYTQSLSVLGGVQTGLLPGEDPMALAAFTYGFDLPWLSLGLRTRVGGVSGDGLDAQSPRSRTSLGVDLVAQRFIDLRLLTLGFGVTVGGTVHRQTFEELRDRVADSRTSYGFSFGALFSAERSLGAGFALRLEGGPIADAFPAADPGPQGNLQDRTEFNISGYGALGVAWRF
ncbi:MAG: caspase family protein [Myxococcota bacterium]